MDNTRRAKKRDTYSDACFVGYKLTPQEIQRRLKEILALMQDAQHGLSITGDHESKLLDWAHNDLANASRRIASELERIDGQW